MRVLALAAAVLLAHAVPAAADDAALDTARAALDKSDYPGARDALTRALAAGDNDRDALVEIHRMTGIVAAALGDPDAATTAFERMLALAPKATLPAGTSPKIVKPFTAAQAYARKHAPLKIDATTGAAPPTVTVTIASDPLHMIERVRAITRVDGGRDELSEEPAEAEVTFTLKPGTRIEVRVVALDDHGNRLAEIGSADVPLVITGGGTTETRPPPTHPTEVELPPPPPHGSRATIAKWWLWGGVAVVAGGVAGGFAYDARRQTDKLEQLNADSSNHRFTEALAVEHRARRDVLIANIGFGVAGAAAVVATILYLTDSGGAHAPAEHQDRQVTATPVVVDGGGALVVEVPF